MIRRAAVYIAMTLAVVTLVFVLVFVMLGYRYNNNDGRIEQGGLVQFDSRPNGANVTIDGQLFRTRTPSKDTLTAGAHSITIGRSGYHTWQKNIDVTPGSVLWLSYARLIPTDLTPKSVADFSTVSSSAVSPSGKWMAVKESKATPEIKLADISGDTVKMSTLTIPTNAYTAAAAGKTHVFTLADWDSDNRHIIVKHTYGGDRTEWLVVDTRDASATKNVTTLLDIQATKMIFAGNDSGRLYAQIGTDVRKIDLSAATISRPLVAKVAEFSLFNDTTIVYSTALDPATKTRSVGYYKDGEKAAVPLRTVTDDGKAQFHLALGRYFGSMYEIIAYGSDVTVLTGDLPESAEEAAKLKEVTKLTFPGGVRYVSVRTDGRFVVMQSGDIYKTYDLELKKETATKLAGKAPVTQKLKWLDGYYAWSDRDGMLRLYEFDGTNQHDIMTVVPGQDVTLTANSKYLYGINKSADGTYHLRRVQMISN